MHLAGLAVAPGGVLELGLEVLVVLLYIDCVIVDGEPINCFWSILHFFFFNFFFWPVCLMVAAVKELKGILERTSFIFFPTQDEQGTLNYLSPEFNPTSFLRQLEQAPVPLEA